MTDTPQLSGRDLARQALATARAAARTAPASTPARRTVKRSARSGGRDPITLAGAIAALGADLPVEAGVAGGNVIDQWATLCPQYADTVQPVAYDQDRGRLDLRPSTYAYAAQLRLLGGQLAKQINDKLGRVVVRTIRVLPVGNLDSPTAAPIADRPDPEAPVRTREDGCPGYREALELALENRPAAPEANPYIEEARQRQIAALRAGRPAESEHREAVWAQADAQEKAGPAPGSVEESLARARAYARQNRGGGAVPRRAFDVA